MIASASVTSALPARAEPTSEAQRNDLFREATRAASAGRWAEAKERLRAAIAIRSSPKLLFSLAQAEEQLGQLASAQADYARALEEARSDGKGDVVQAAETAQRALASRVPHIRVSTSESRATATIDERPLTLGMSMAVDPGEHRIVVSAPGMRSVVTEVKVVEGQMLDVPVSLERDRGGVTAAPTMAMAPAPAQASEPAKSRTSEDVEPPRETSPSSGGSTMKTAGLITGGAGVVALGVGAAFGLASISKHDDAARACPNATCPTASGAQQWHDAVVAGNASTIAFVIGGVAVAAGAVLWIAAPKNDVRVGVGPSSVRLEGAW